MPMSGTRTPVQKSPGDLFFDSMLPVMTVLTNAVPDGEELEQALDNAARRFLSRFRACDGPCAGSVPGYYTDVGGDCPTCGGTGWVEREDNQNHGNDQTPEKGV